MHYSNVQHICPHTRTLLWRCIEYFHGYSPSTHLSSTVQTEMAQSFGTFFFFNIVSLLMLTLYNYYGPDSRVIIVQLVLISLSFGYIVIYTAIKIHQQYPLLKMSMFRLTNSVKIDDDDDDVDILSDNFPYPTVVLKNNSYCSFR